MAFFMFYHLFISVYLNMNYLGHLYFSENNKDLMIANLYGDYFKGNKYDELPLLQRTGVKLHRAIDDFIDTNKGVKELFKELYADLPKIAGIAVDLYFDHLLAKHWSQFHDRKLENFVSDFYAHTELINYPYPEQFLHMIHYMKQGDWLLNYKYLEGLDSAARGLSRRISFPNELYKAKEVFVKNEELITNHFFSYMQEAVDNFYLPDSQKLLNFNLKS